MNKEPSELQIISDKQLKETVAESNKGRIVLTKEQSLIFTELKSKIIIAMFHKTEELLVYANDQLDNLDEFEHVEHNLNELLKDMKDWY